MTETYDDVYQGLNRNGNKTCGGVIKMPLKEYHIRDRVYYLRLFNRKGIKSHESIMWAGDLDDAEVLYQQVKDTLPKHSTHEFSDYYGTNTPLEMEKQ